MPCRNQVKSQHAVERLFHVYNRGISREPIFRSRVDQAEFLQCFRRHLSPREFRDDRGRVYRKLADRASVVAYCLMDNHFHMIVRQIRPRGMSEILRSALSGYVPTHSRRHRRTGRLFESPYKATEIADVGQAMRAIAYVHTNHPTGPDHELCSHPLFVGREQCDWVDTQTGLDVFGGVGPYAEFLANYIAAKSD